MADPVSQPTASLPPETAPLTWAQRCIFTASLSHGAWWLDRVNPTGKTKEACGPYPDELTALRAANEMNQLNQGWIDYAG